MSSDFPRDRRPSGLEQSLEKGYDRDAEKELDENGDSPDQRSPFERDRDRLLYSREFRRLKDVTQVVRSGESYLYHDRLTHSLKVAQVGRRLAELLERVYQNDIDDLSEHLNPDVVEAACLAHDIGHPPFGHVTEELLDNKVREKTKDDCESAPTAEEESESATDSTEGFEGNAQSFRTVTKLCSHRPGVEGMDLTRATLNAIQKYPWERDAELDVEEDTDNKWGFYPTERAYFEFTRADTHEERQKVLEAEIMDYADDLTYAIHDVEDFYRSGLIPFDQLLREASELSSLLPDSFDEVEDDLYNYSDMFEEVSDSQEMYLHAFGEYVEGEADVDASLADVLVFFVELCGFASITDEFYSPYEGTQLERNQLNHFSSSMVSRYLEATEQRAREREYIQIDNHSVDDAPTLEIDESFKREIGILKKLTFYYVISNPTLAGQQRGQIEIIDRLYEDLHEEANPNSIESSAILEPYRERIDALDVDDESLRARIVADMVSNMTETQAVEMYQRLVGARPGSLQDEIMRQ